MKLRSSLLFFLIAGTLAIHVSAAVNREAPETGNFISLKQSDGVAVRGFVSGPADAKAGILIVPDYLGISEATERSVERLGALGYRVLAIDLYGGKSATLHEDAVKLMESVDPKDAALTVQTGLDYLKQPGRKLATVGFSMGGQHALNANLNDPASVSATVVIYGFGFDSIDTPRLQKLQSPVLVISGSEDKGAADTAIHYLSNMQTAKRACELFIYPGADHGYMQPLFNSGKNYRPEAARATWVVVDDFLANHLANN